MAWCRIERGETTIICNRFETITEYRWNNPTGLYIRVVPKKIDFPYMGVLL